MEVEVAVLSSPSLLNSPYCLRGRKATLTLNGKIVRAQKLCVKVEVAVLGSPPRP